MSNDQAIFWYAAMPMIYMSVVFFSPAVFLTGLASGAAFSGAKAYLIGAVLAAVALVAANFHVFEESGMTPLEGGIYTFAGAVSGALWVLIFRVGRGIVRRMNRGAGA